MSFSDKVVLVTGASSGIGAATAVLFAKEGARVALVARNETKLSNVAQRCEQHGSKPLIIKADIANEQQASTIVKKTVEHFGKLDVLVNNAGIARYASVMDVNVVQTFDEVIQTNLRSVVQLTSLAAPHLISTKGNVVNVSSVVAHCVTGPNFMPYSVSKAGLDHYTRCAALDMAASGVRVNSVNPGPVRTDIVENSGLAPAGQSEEMWEKIKSITALGRVADPEEIADLIAYLASDKAKSITGSVFVADNGYLINPNSQFLEQ